MWQARLKPKSDIEIIVTVCNNLKQMFSPVINFSLHQFHIFEEIHTVILCDTFVFYCYEQFLQDSEVVLKYHQGHCYCRIY